MTFTRIALVAVPMLIGNLMMVGGPAWADDATAINWTRLQLNRQQQQHIQSLESKWNRNYMDVQPAIVEDQRRMTRLLADPKSDPVDIMALQQSIARKREQLRAEATANYLRKRQVLNQNQQHQLENMLRQQMDMRQRQIRPSGFQPDVMPDKIQELMRRVRNIWPGDS